ncbi:MAG: glycosyltransferase family 4 protein [Kiritimatiellae bacterium]|nr:glycosyltransferase family 4 protein [Kiritimatiellia bacterium]
MSNRFYFDHCGFELLFDSRMRVERGGVWAEWLRNKRAGFRMRMKRLLTGCDDNGVFSGEKALAKALEAGRDGWVYVSAWDFWRLDGGCGKRMYGLGREIAKKRPVLLVGWLSPGDDAPAMFRELGGGVSILRVPTSMGWTDYHLAALENGHFIWKGSEEGTAFFSELARNARGWIFENPWMHSAMTPRPCEWRRVLYWPPDAIVDKYSSLGADFQALRQAEREILERAEQVTFCTEGDKQATLKHHPGLSGDGWKILPNGIYAEDTLQVVPPSKAMECRKKLGYRRHVVLFAGANTIPNDEAVTEITRKWAPRHTDVTFVILGLRLDRYLRAGGIPPADNMVFPGWVTEEEKRALYALSDLAIMPLRSGSGSSLKVPEAIAAGKVVIGTAVGLRGFADWCDGKSIIQSEHGEDLLRGLLEKMEVEPGEFATMCRRNAAKVANTLSWGGIFKAVEKYGW